MAVLQSLTSLTGFCYRFRESLKAGRNLNIMPSFGLSVLESEKSYSCGNLALLLCPVKLNAYKSQLKYATILLFKRTTISDPTQQQVMMKIHALLLLLGKPKLVDFSSSHIALLPTELLSAAAVWTPWSLGDPPCQERILSPPKVGCPSNVQTSHPPSPCESAPAM